MALKKCKECGEEISSSAKVCPKCGKRLKMSLGLRLFLFIIFIIILAFAFGNKNQNNNSTITNTIEPITSNSIVNRENYDKIEKGMTKEQVKAILGEPQSISENESPGIGTMELNHYQEGITLIGIDIYYIDGKVYMKNYTEL